MNIQIFMRILYILCMIWLGIISFTHCEIIIGYICIVLCILEVISIILLKKDEHRNKPY